jgi:serine protease inhibitor
MIKSKFIIAFAVLSIAILISGIFFSAGCSGGNNEVEAEEEPEKKITPDESDELAALIDKNLIDSNTLFGFNILKELILEDRDQNVFISPLSILLALAMTYNGAAGDTKLAMSDALEFDAFELEELNSEFNGLLESIKNADSDIDLSIANSIWYMEGREVKEDFIERNIKYFDSEIIEIDFYAPGSIDKINGWIEKETRGKIDKMISEIDIPEELVMYLINAIYFKGNWSSQFDETYTSEGEFYPGGGSTVKVPMMSQQESFGYYKGDNFSGIRLPYGQEKITMYVILPDEGVEVDEVIESMSEKRWNEIRSSFSANQISLVMPKYKVEYGIKLLNNVLAGLGMGIAFEPGVADFTGIFNCDPGEQWISRVLHKAVIEVNEKGSEAAAATVVEIVESAMPVEEIIEFVVNRPFFFVIADDRSGSILFMGKIVKP